MRAAVAEPEALDPPAHSRAQVVLAAAHGFKSMALDSEDMRQLIRDLVGLTVAGSRRDLDLHSKTQRRHTHGLSTVETQGR